MTDTPPLALVTGASSGIGFELARQFAERGYEVIIAAEDAAIDVAAESLRRSGARVRPLRIDLHSTNGPEQLYASATEDGRVPDAVAFNAGVGRGGDFLSTDLGDELAVIDLNVVSTVRLAKPVVADMAARGSGRLLFTSSIAAMMPGPEQAVYHASKSFVQSFAEALRQELRDKGITVTALMPGPTDTDFFRRAKMLDTRIGRGPKDDPAEVARQGVDALLAGDQRVVAASLPTKVMGVVGRVVPDALKAKAGQIISGR